MSEVNKIGWKQKIDLERPVALFFNFFFDCRVLREKAHRNIINSTAARDVLKFNKCARILFAFCISKIKMLAKLNQKSQLLFRFSFFQHYIITILKNQNLIRIAN